MSTTTSLGFVKPGSGTEPADGYGAIGALADSINDWATDLLVSSWVTFTPTWTSSGTAPAIGNGTLAGRYRQVGKTVEFEIRLTAGTTTTYGTGNYSLGGLPVGPLALVMVSGYARDDSASNYYPIFPTISTGATTCFLRSLPTTAGNALASVTNTVPFTFANLDTIIVNGTFETA